MFSKVLEQEKKSNNITYSADLYSPKLLEMINKDW